MTPARIVAVDPGHTRSAYVLASMSSGGVSVHERGLVPNPDLLAWLRARPSADVLVLEQIQGMGMAVGAEVFETCVWTGRFIEAWRCAGELPFARVPRRDVKLYLCGQARAKDPNVRQALLDRFGGKSVAVGTKKAPGPLYGIKADIWAALAVAVTYLEGEHYDENGKAKV